jgi:Tol biopolymer transport system component
MFDPSTCPRVASLSRRLSLYIGITALMACGGDGNDPSEPRVASVVPIAGHTVTDTVQALLAQPLVVEVRGENGKPKAGAAVQFEAEPRGGGAYVEIGLAEGPMVSGAVSSTTDDKGRASLRVRLGRVAGAARVLVSVPELGVRAVVPYTVAPGAPVRIMVAPADTPVYVGASYPLRAGLADRFQNLHPEPVTFGAGSTKVSASATGTVTGVAVGRAKIVVRVANLRDSAFVSVVPFGILSVRDMGRFVGDTMGIAVVGLDGSGYRRVVPLGITPSSYSPSNVDPPEWIPRSDRLVFTRMTDGVSRLFTSDPSGSVRRLIMTTSAALSEADATVSSDGSWIYFVGGVDPYRQGLWRVRTDGSAPERLPSSAIEPREIRGPSVSPDGNRLAYIARDASYGDFHLFVRNIATGSAARLSDLEVAVPRWSPRGDLIAYTSGAPYAGYSGALRVVRPDGTGDRPVIAGDYYPGVDWSPDGRYLLAYRANPGAYGLELIDVETGERIPLAYRGSWFAATWRR